MELSDDQIRLRDGNRCARDGGTEALHIHHRWMRSAGRDERACNRVTLCWRCHEWIHHHPAAAFEAGWLVSRYGDPALVKVQHFLWPLYPVWLEPDGGIRLVDMDAPDSELPAIYE